MDGSAMQQYGDYGAQMQGQMDEYGNAYAVQGGAMQHSEMQGGGMQHAEMQGPGMQGPGMQGGYGPSRSGSGFQPHPDGAGEPPQHHQLEQQVQHQQPHLQQQQMQQQPPLPQQAPPPMPAPGYPRGDGYSVEGKLFLGGLDNATTRQSLLDYVTQWGEVSDYVLMEQRGFGFVTFTDPAHAQAFLEQREHIIDGKRVEAKAAVPKNSKSTPGLTKKMFVGGTGEISDAEFKQYFDQFGDIEDCVVLRKEDGSSRGFGFVTFRDEVSVEKCLVMQHNLNGRTVELKRAIKKEDMAGAAAGGGGYGDFYGGGGMAMGGGYGGGMGGGYGQGVGSGGPMRGGPRQNDWMCPVDSCRNKNFGWREFCNRCQAPKPENPKTVIAAAAERQQQGASAVIPAGGYGRPQGGDMNGGGGQYDGSGGSMGGYGGMGNMGGMPGMGMNGMPFSNMMMMNPMGMSGMPMGNMMGVPMGAMGGMGMNPNMFMGMGGMPSYGQQGQQGQMMAQGNGYAQGAAGAYGSGGYGRQGGRGYGSAGGQGRYRPY